MTDITEFAKVIGVAPGEIQVEISSTEKYQQLDRALLIGSYLQISDDADSALVAVVRSYQIRDSLGKDDGTDITVPRFVLTLEPVGRLEGGSFKRGGKQITIPPKKVEIASDGLLDGIYAAGDQASALSFSTLAQHGTVRVNLDGDRFFGKHIGVVGATGSGKSSTVAAMLQEGIRQSEAQAKGATLNNAHIIIFDLHGEYTSAFPHAVSIGANELRLPYWLMNAEELEELFIESNEHNSHNQVSQFRAAVIANKRRNNAAIPADEVTYDSPVYFSLEEVTNYLRNLNSEVIGKLAGEDCPKLADGTLVQVREDHYFDQQLEFTPANQSAATKASNGAFFGEFNRFLLRLESRQADRRLDFLLAPKKPGGGEYITGDLDEIVENLIGYSDTKANVTILDLSGVPFEMLSIVVSLATRLVFTFSFHFKKAHKDDGLEMPFLLVYEEAHNYVPRSEGARYNSVKRSIERVAKEGRKYGISIMVVSQRPSEVSETVFSQCNNFVAMRLTNPTDQQYVKRLLPDSLAAITESLASLEQREAILLGDAIALPSVVRIDAIEHLPTSHDVNFMREWREDWLASAMDGIIERWRK